MRIDISDIADRLHKKGKKSDDKVILNIIEEAIVNDVRAYMDGKVDEILAIMQDLEHAEPRCVSEYSERYGTDKD